MTFGTRIRRAAGREDGFTMIVAIMVMLVSSLLVAAAFVSASGDVTLTRANTNQKEAYYAAMAGISAYKYQLNANPSYWQTCPSIPVATSTEKEFAVPGASEEKYKVKTVPATGSTECVAGKLATIAETSGSAAGTFRIESTGIYGKGTKNEAKRSLVATFTHPGYLNYVYLSNFEEADPETTGKSETECEFYRKEREAKKLTNCFSFPWIPADKIEGPFHTNDTAEISGSPVFGRKAPEHNDAIEMNGSYTPKSATPKFEGTGYTENGATLLPPETSATELLSEAGGKYTGRTIIVLEGNKMSVTLSSGAKETAVPFPSNGVIAVENASSGCPVKYKALETMYGTEDANCGNVYIKGEYTKSLTVIAQNDVIITGNLTTEGGTSGGEPKGSAALGLIAIQHARLYHPIKECEAFVTHEAESEVEVTEKSAVLKHVTPTTSVTLGAEVSGTKIKAGTTVSKTENLASKGEITISVVVQGAGTAATHEKVKFITKPKEVVECKNTESTGGAVTCNSAGNATSADKPAKEFGESIKNPVIDAAILSTNHSWGVDNYSCPLSGGGLGSITIWGSIAENWRGRVTCCLNASEGIYIKNYKYDERLKNIQPPEFLAPTSTVVTLSRVTAPPISFGEG
jgi:type II secretory pathway pseudopilin PulG